MKIKFYFLVSYVVKVYKMAIIPFKLLFCVLDKTVIQALVMKIKFYFLFSHVVCPVGWSCRIRRLHLCRGVRPPLPMRPPVDRGWWPLRRYDGTLVVEQSLIRRQSGLWLATYHFGPYLVWRAVGLGPIRSIGWSCQALAPIYFISTVLLNLDLQVPNPYQLVARRRWLRVNCVENRNLTSAENLKMAKARRPTLNSSILVAHPPSQPRRMGYPLGSFPTKVGLRGGWWRAGPVTNIQHIWRLQAENLNETSQNQTRRMRQQISPDSLLLNLWRRSA